MHFCSHLFHYCYLSNWLSYCYIQYLNVHLFACITLMLSDFGKKLFDNFSFLQHCVCKPNKMFICINANIFSHSHSQKLKEERHKQWWKMYQTVLLKRLAKRTVTVNCIASLFAYYWETQKINSFQIPYVYNCYSSENSDISSNSFDLNKAVSIVRCFTGLLL